METDLSFFYDETTATSQSVITSQLLSDGLNQKELKFEEESLIREEKRPHDKNLLEISEQVEPNHSNPCHGYLRLFADCCSWFSDCYNFCFQNCLRNNNPGIHSSTECNSCCFGVENCQAECSDMGLCDIVHVCCDGECCNNCLDCCSCFLEWCSLFTSCIG